MKRLAIVLIALVLYGCGGGGDSGPKVPEYTVPTVTISGPGTVDAGSVIEVTVTISDPENRISDWAWELSTDAEEFSYEYNSSSVSFTSPLWPTIQNITVKYGILYTVPVLDANGNVAQDSRILERQTNISVNPIVPEVPGLLGTSLSQSGELNWSNSDGTGYYRFYVNGDEGVFDAYNPELVEQNKTYFKFIRYPIYKWDGEEWQKVKDLNLLNGESYTFQVSAINDAGESAKSNLVTIEPKAPENEILKVTNFEDEYDLTRLDYLGNPVSSDSDKWAAVKDNNSGLIWQVKCMGNKIAGDVSFDNCSSYLGDVDDAFTYYESDKDGKAYGFDNPDGSNCLFQFSETGYPEQYCNTENYISAMNSPNPFDNGTTNGDDNYFEKLYAGRDDWRLPTLDEVLQFIQHEDEYAKPFPTDYFSYSPAIGEYIRFWTKTESNNPSENFIVLSGANAFIESVSTTEEYQVIAVSGKDEEPNNEQIEIEIECFFYENPDGDSDTYFYEYTRTELTNLLADKRNETGIDWRIPSMRELAYFRNSLPKYGEEEYVKEGDGWSQTIVINPSFMTRDKTPQGYPYDDWIVGIGEDGTFYLGDWIYGSWYYCLSRPK